MDKLIFRTKICFSHQGCALVAPVAPGDLLLPLSNQETLVLASDLYAGFPGYEVLEILGIPQFFFLSTVLPSMVEIKMGLQHPVGCCTNIYIHCVLFDA